MMNREDADDGDDDAASSPVARTAPNTETSLSRESPRTRRPPVDLRGSCDSESSEHEEVSSRDQRETDGNAFEWRDDSEVRTGASPDDSAQARKQRLILGVIISCARKSLDNRKQRYRRLLASNGRREPANFGELYDVSWLDAATIAEIARLWNHRSAVSGEPLELCALRVVKWNPELASRPSNSIACTAAESGEHNRAINSNSERAPHAQSIMKEIASRAALFGQPARYAETWKPLNTLIEETAQSDAAAAKRKRTPHDRYVDRPQRARLLHRPGWRPLQTSLKTYPARHTLPGSDGYIPGHGPRIDRRNARKEGPAETDSDADSAGDGDHDRGEDGDGCDARVTPSPPEANTSPHAVTRVRMPSRRAIEALASESTGTPQLNPRPPSSAEPQAAGSGRRIPLSVTFGEMTDGIREVIGRMRAATDTMVALEGDVADMKDKVADIMSRMSDSSRF